MLKRKFDFEEKFQALQTKIDDLRNLALSEGFDLDTQIKSLEKKMEAIKTEKFKNLAPWEKVLLSRHQERPNIRDYIECLLSDWVELHGDRCYGDDQAIIGGIGFFNDIPVTVIGHQKGKNTKENLRCNFGMPNPEGYRKALRLIKQAEKFNRPVLTFIDTPGAYPGIGAEERGQAWAISQLLMNFSVLQVPVVSVITGEGGSGGALALAVADRLYMLSNAVFSVASMEACASILWKDAEKADEMAKILRITAQDLYALQLIDTIIEEPVGGAHKDMASTALEIKKHLEQALDQLLSTPREELLETRKQRLRNIGKFIEQ